MIQTNKWSCVLDSFAFVSGIPQFVLIADIGHDGTNKGFHTQELIEVMLAHGRAVTEIQRYPRATHPVTLKQRTITFKEGGEPDSRFVRHLVGNEGVLLGVNAKRSPHAVAWYSNRIYDPATGESSIYLRKNSQGGLSLIGSGHPFSSKIFLRITSIT